MFCLIFINSRGFNSRKENLIFYHLRSASLAFDFCFIEETMISDPVFYNSFASRWRGPCFWSPSIGRGGVLLSLFQTLLKVLF